MLSQSRSSAPGGSPIFSVLGLVTKSWILVNLAAVLVVQGVFNDPLSVDDINNSWLVPSQPTMSDLMGAGADAQKFMSALGVSGAGANRLIENAMAKVATGTDVMARCGLVPGVAPTSGATFLGASVGSTSGGTQDLQSLFASAHKDPVQELRDRQLRDALETQGFRIDSSAADGDCQYTSVANHVKDLSSTGYVRGFLRREDLLIDGAREVQHFVDFYSLTGDLEGQRAGESPQDW